MSGLVGKRCAAALMSVLTALPAACGLQDAGEGPLTEEHPDPRAVRGSDPDISLDRALRDLGLTLPSGADQVRFKSRHDSEPYYLNMAFTLPCSRTSDVVQSNGLIASEQADNPHSIGEDGLRRAAEGVGVRVPPGANPRFYASKSDFMSYKRGALRFAVDGLTCRFVVVVEKYV